MVQRCMQYKAYRKIVRGQMSVYIAAGRIVQMGTCVRPKYPPMVPFLMRIISIIRDHDRLSVTLSRPNIRHMTS